MKIEVYPEVCCDECSDIIHNHIDCPVCNMHYAGTDAFYALWEESGEITITCDCGAEFRTTDRAGYIDDWE